VDFEKWYKIIIQDEDLKKWFQNFLDEVTDFYDERFKVVKRLKKL
jgi:hypothetical protein